ncbi:MAG: bifunctional hydroxymethylpyrimidine kinase/phosphomethylpyrimidine kinase [Desulfobulbaceae bacterium]|nr:bifunctional hydroxymethylpyrimidine kinase/phosphomethylpyrimidine kinase [Desulfobulbaceae bacterium]
MSGQAQAILTIAGSDPSGGAGIQADLKTLTVLGVYGCAAVTSLTVQNTLGVQSCHPVVPEVVAQQVAAVLADMCVTHIKIGMIGSSAIAQGIVQALSGFAGEIIYDPIVFSSVGQAVRTTDSLDGVRQIAAMATVLTPNLQELQLLSSTPCSSIFEVLAAGEGLLRSFPNLKALVIKGGHLQEKEAEVTDFLLIAGQTQHESRRHRRIVSPNTHGTGCTFASAFAAYHQQTGEYRQAFHLAIDFLDSLLCVSAEWRLGQGNGGLCHHLFAKGA